MKNKPHESPDCQCTACREWELANGYEAVFQSLEPQHSYEEFLGGLVEDLVKEGRVYDASGHVLMSSKEFWELWRKGGSYILRPKYPITFIKLDVTI